MGFISGVQLGLVFENWSMAFIVRTACKKKTKHDQFDNRCRKPFYKKQTSNDYKNSENRHRIKLHQPDKGIHEKPIASPIFSGKRLYAFLPRSRIS